MGDRPRFFLCSKRIPTGIHEFLRQVNQPNLSQKTVQIRHPGLAVHHGDYKKFMLYQHFPHFFRE